MSTARWFLVPYLILIHLIGFVFPIPVALMFMNYAHKRRFRHGG